MRSQTVSTGCDGPEGEGRPRAPRRQDAIGAGAGLFVEHALMSASHHLQLAALGSVADVFAF